MALKRVATFKASTGKPHAIVLGLDNKVLSLTHAQVLGRTEEQVQAQLEQLAIVANVDLPTIWVHKNRDGSWAIATGEKPPPVWPEDEDPDDNLPAESLLNGNSIGH